MSKISTHVLDTVLGKPAPGISLRLDRQHDNAWEPVAYCTTDADGRCRDLLEKGSGGVYRLTFDTGSYFACDGRRSIYPEISITFTCDADQHYHLPLLLSDNGYTTYRGS